MSPAGLVRDATADDAAACRDAHAPSLTGSAVSFETGPPTAEEMARRIAAAQERHAWPVIDDGGAVRGCAYGGPFAAREAYRWSCSVSVHLEPGRRRTGAGRVGAPPPSRADRRAVLRSRRRTGRGGTVRTLLTSFKNFAFSGSLVDLAVGLAIGAAFAAVVESLVGDVILPLVAAIFGQPDFTALVLTVNGTQIRYGSFLTAMVSFLLLALTIMFLVQAVRRATGRETAGAQGSRECDHCKSFIPVDASVCMFCTRDVEPVVP